MRRELLAAYASGGLDPAEAAEMEALLAADPTARAELDEIVRALDAVRAAAQASGEPDWDAMAADIQQACAEREPRRPGWFARLLAPERWWARPAGAALAAAAVAAAAIALMGRGSEESAAPAPSPVAVVTPAARAVESDEEDPGVYPDLREPELDDLHPDELDQLERDLDAGPDHAFVADLLRAGRSDPGLIADLTRERDDKGERADPGDKDEPAIDPFRSPDYVPVEDIADQIPDDAIDAIDRFLAEVQAG